MLEKLIESISFRINLQIKECKGSNTAEVSLKCADKEIKECLREIEEYLHDYQNLSEQINNERKKLKYYTSYNTNWERGITTITHSVTPDSYKSCSLIRLLMIRKVLITSLDRTWSSIKLETKIGDWLALERDTSIKLTGFCAYYLPETSLRNNLEKMKEALNQRLGCSDTNYFAFYLSNSIYTEPYVLKISGGKIQEVICSASGHTSTDLHADLWEFIKSNNPAHKVYPTFPLKHDGDCTRYTEYALIQFTYRSEKYGEERAFLSLKKSNPYPLNRNIIRDFQIFSHNFGYDLLKKIIYPLPNEVAQQIGIELSQANAPTVKTSSAAYEERLFPLDQEVESNLTNSIQPSDYSFYLKCLLMSLF